MRYRALLLGVLVWLLVCVLASADVPRLINFQGRLTDATGKFVTDGNYSLTFRIYADSTGGSSKWSETQSVAVSKGLLNVILGSNTPIPDSIFNYPNTWLSIQVASDPEMTPRQRLSSLGYSYRGAKADTSTYSKDSDKLDGLHASDFSSVGTDYGRSGVTTDLYEGTVKLIDKYLQQGQANSVNSSMIVDSTITNADISGTANISPSKISGTAWTSTNDGTSSGLDADLLDGQHGSYYTNAANISTGVLGDGRLSANVDLLNNVQTFTGVKTFNPSSGSVPFAVDATKNGAVTNLNADLLDGQHGSAFLSSSVDYGRSGVATDLYEGTSNLTSKYVNVAGPDSVYSTYDWAFKGKVSGSNTLALRGIYGYGDNSSSGFVFGGYFETSTNGTGYHVGALGAGFGSSASTRGTEGDAWATSTSDAMGIFGWGDNTSSGNAYGGWFNGTSSGTGAHYGVYSQATTATSSAAYGSYSSAYSSNGYAYGSYGYANNTSTGFAYGGLFETTESGTGMHTGVVAIARGSSSWQTYGISSFADNTSTGDAIGGYFEVSNWGSGVHYGIKAASYGSTNGSVYGTYGEAISPSNATGNLYGAYGKAYTLGSGSTYGGYFIADSAGSGTGYGIYAQASVVYWAGWFQGDLGVSHNLYVYGSKSAAVKVNSGEYHAMYSQESPENWFEDFGEGQLVNGKVHIDLDPLFQQTVTINSLNSMKVFVQLEGDCNGVFVTKGTTGFDVTELKGGASSVAFSYRVVAKRKGYENMRLDRMKGPSPEEMTLEQAKHQTEFAREETQRQEERKRMEQQRLEMQKQREMMKPEPGSFPTQSKK